MQPQSKVLEIPAAEPDKANAYFEHKLSFETDPADVHSDLKNGIDGFIFADVRAPEAYAQSHAVGAINLPHPEINADRLSEFPQDKVFVVYCWGPGCNGADKAAYKLSKLGRKVKIMIGGIEYWEDKERYPVERNSQ